MSNYVSIVKRNRGRLVLKSVEQMNSPIKVIDLNENENAIISRIQDFHLVYIYNDKNDINYLKKYAKDIVYGEKESIPLFSNVLEGETFVVTETAYNQNESLFDALRQSARDNIFKRLANGVTASYLSDYANIIETSILSLPKLKNKDLLDISVEKVYTLLEKETLLAEESAWSNLYEWFKSYVTQYVVRELIKENGPEKIKEMEQEALNDLFQIHLVKHTQMNVPLMINSVKTVEQYLQKWIKKIIPLLHEEYPSNQHVELFLGMKTDSAITPNKKIALPLTMTDNYLSIMSNVVYQAIKESLSNQCFQPSDDMPWPTSNIQKRTLKGTIQIKPYNHKEKQIDLSIHKAWKQVETLSELDVDVFDALCSFFISSANHQQDVIEIKLQDLLVIRGIKAKKSGNGRRGGYEAEQVRQIFKSLSIIQDIWTDFNQVTVYKKGKSMEIALDGRTFIFLDKHHQVTNITEHDPTQSIYFTVDKVFSEFLRGSGRQIALLPIEVLQYNPHQEKWEKKISRYLSWRWRTQARKEDYQQPYKIGTLLEAIGIEINERTPSRTRERFEQALDRLQDDRLIAAWEYIDWDEAIAINHGWARIWKNTRIVITPPETIKKQYQSIARNGKVQLNSHKKNEQDKNLGLQLKNHRKKLGLTLVQAAKELDISAVYVSMIERGKRIPSKKVANQIINWI